MSNNYCECYAIQPSPIVNTFQRGQDKVLVYHCDASSLLLPRLCEHLVKAKTS